MHYALENMFFNILLVSSHLLTWFMKQSQNPFLPKPQTVLQMKLGVLQRLSKIYKTIDVLYKTTLYIQLVPQNSFSPFFGLVSKRNVVTNIYSIYFC